MHCFQNTTSRGHPRVLGGGVLVALQCAPSPQNTVLSWTHRARGSINQPANPWRRNPRQRQAQHIQPEQNPMHNIVPFLFVPKTLEKGHLCVSFTKMPVSLLTACAFVNVTNLEFSLCVCHSLCLYNRGWHFWGLPYHSICCVLEIEKKQMLMLKHILNYFQSIWQQGLTLVKEQLCINGRLFCLYFSWKKTNLKEQKKDWCVLYKHLLIKKMTFNKYILSWFWASIKLHIAIHTCNILKIFKFFLLL